ncbi:Zinc knuckle [Hirschfeldia incana]|nr:Zinc knuckle [Hirschfeldia incana]
MPRRIDENEDREEVPAAIREASDEEEDEANEDLSLKILEKALSRRESDDSKDTTFSADLSGSGVVSTVMVNGRDSSSKSHKKKKTKKRTSPAEEDANEIPIVWKEEDEKILKGEDNEKPAEPTATASNMVLKKLLRGARYFDPPDAGLDTCYSCGEPGHATINCPTPTTRKKPCFICGSLEHGAKQCTKGHDCYICKKSGHRARDCPDKYKSGSKSAVCLRCGDFGHDMILCKYDYSRDDLKDIQCYVCKSFGHLCCVEPGNSPSWAVSCYRCGQLGHIGLACGRYHEESTEKDSASSCFRCGEEGHFSRECPNSSSISTPYGRDSPSLCYRCNGAGHFARECPNSIQVSKRNREASTPSRKSHKRFKESPEYNSTPYESSGKKTKKKKNKENSEHDSTPYESTGKKKKKKSKEDSQHYSTPLESNGKMRSKKKTHKGEEAHSTPRKSKQRGGWMTEDPEEDSFQRGKMRRARSPVTPSGHNHHTYTGGHKQRSPAFHSGGSFPTTPYGRNSSFESNGRVSSHPHSRWQQPYYPPSRHHHHQHNQRYAPAPSSRYGSAPHHYDEF